MRKKLLTNALANHWRKYRKHLKACSKIASEDNVHKLRVSTRRLLSLIELFGSLDPHPSLIKIRKSLKNQLDGFDELRDTQVMLFEAAKSMPILPELEPFLSFLHQREQQLLQKNRSVIANLYQPKLRRKVKKVGNRLKTRIRDTDLNRPVSAAIDKVYAKAISRYQALDPTDLASIHRLRIAVKKLRYMLSAVQAMIPGLKDHHLKQIQSYLTRMGDIQNSTVLLQSLGEFFEQEMHRTIEHYYQHQQQTLISTFIASSTEILGFWGDSDNECSTPKI